MTSQYATFDELLSDVRACSARRARAQVEAWINGFGQLWTGDSEQWIALTASLPFPRGADRTKVTVETFDAAVSSPSEIFPPPLLIFLTAIARAKLSARYWKNQLSREAVELCAGLVNLHRIVSHSRSALIKPLVGDLRNDLAQALATYPITLLAIGTHHPNLVQFDGQECSVIGGLHVQVNQLREQLLGSSNVSVDARNSLSIFLRQIEARTDDALRLLKDGFMFDAENAAHLLRLALAEKLDMPCDLMLRSFLDTIPEQQMADGSQFEQLVMSGLPDDGTFPEANCLSIVQHCPFSSRRVSNRLAHVCREMQRFSDDTRRNAFRLWAAYLAPEDEFRYGWTFFHAQSSFQGKHLFGESVDDRASSLEGYVVHSLMELEFRSHHRHERNRGAWHATVERRQAWVEFFRAVMSLLAMNARRYRADVNIEEIAVRQLAAIAALAPHSDAAAVAIRGVLDLAEEHWSYLDPIVLGLPQEVVVATLAEYAKFHRTGPDTKRFHAEALLRHAQGEPLPARPDVTESSGILGAVENLIEVSRSRMSRDRSETWLGDIGVESLWRGATEAACKEFAPWFDAEGGQDEHELVFFLATKITDHLRVTNSTIHNWLTDRWTIPLLMDVSVRRFQRKEKEGAPGEGGPSGVHADLGLIFICDVPGLAQTSRVTLIQAKKCWVAKGVTALPGTLPVEEAQLHGLLRRSDHGHYLFLFPSVFAPTPLIVPAKFVKDVLRAQNSKAIPVPVIMRAAKDLPSFLIHDVMGLWTGDTDEDVLRAAQAGGPQGVGPKVMIEIRVSVADHNHHEKAIRGEIG